jgi:hypothetical protein
VDDNELDRLDRESGGGVVILNVIVFFGVVTLRDISDNRLCVPSFTCLEAGDGVNGEPRTGSDGCREARQARLFLNSKGGGRRETSTIGPAGLKNARQGEKEDPKDSSLEAGEVGLHYGGTR